MQPVKVAAIQFNHQPGKKALNLECVERLASEAASAAVQIAVFPEMCLTGYWHVRHLDREQIVNLAESVPTGPLSQAVLAMAERMNMTIGVGLIELAEDGQLYNSYLVAMPDGSFAVHRKLHCFISEHMASGDRYTVFDTPHGVRVGVLICYDNNIGENVRMNALMGAEVLLSPHQTGGCDSPSPHCMGTIEAELWHRRNEDPDKIEAEFRGPKGREWLMRWLPARAHDNGLFLVFSNGVGIDDDEVRTGNSMVLDPYGSVLAETWKADEAMVVADLDPALQATCTGRRWIKSRRPDLYQTLAQPTGNEQDTRHVRFAQVESS